MDKFLDAKGQELHIGDFVRVVPEIATRPTIGKIIDFFYSKWKIYIKPDAICNTFVTPINVRNNWLVAA